MSTTSRRSFLTAAVAGMASSHTFAQTLRRALATPANGRTGTLADVEHVVILMQENRSFDHYFGTLAGVRGFSDPRPIALPSGQPVWMQPGTALGTQVLPYHFDIRNTNALRVGLDHSWKGTEAAWKDWNAWIAKKSPRTMGYFDRSDLPFYYALADAFTVCDAYHCSIFGPTDPNRFYALTGHSNATVTGIADSRLYNVTGGVYNGDIANDNPAAKGNEWLTYAETLEAAGVSWKVYQEWDNYGDNYLQYFKNFRTDANGQKLTAASPLYRRGRALAAGSTQANAAGTTGQFLIDQFAADVRSGQLPRVSYICAPTEYCEHPSDTPNAGENFTARLLQALVQSPEVWSKTALILTYDENDGFFDHMPAVMAPLNADRGRTTMSNATVGEIAAGQPIGLGPRVPTMVISPWSKGGRVCSQRFDHTSLIRFTEEWLVSLGYPRASVQCNGISPWRRAVCGDMTSAFDFNTGGAEVPAGVPATAVYFKGWGTRDALPPSNQSLPRQEKATSGVPRRAAPLPFRSSVDGIAATNVRQFALSFANEGKATAAFIVYSTLRTDGPWHYTVEPGKRIDQEVWNWSSAGMQLSVHGDNGFLREFRMSFDGIGRLAAASLSEQPGSASLTLTLRNASTQTMRFRVVDNAYGDRTVVTVDVPAGASRDHVRSVSSSFGWYDLVVTVDGDTAFWRRLAGHVEGAGLDYTDPVLNGLAQVSWNAPPVLPPTSTPVSFKADVDRVRIGGSVSLSWSGLPAGTTHWIGLYRVGMTPGGPGSLKWNYVASPGGSQVFSLAGQPEGDYFLGLFLNDGYGEAAARLPVRVRKNGDVNADGAITAADRDSLRNAIGSCAGDTRFEPLADMDGDKCVTQADYRVWYQLFSTL
ncbi:phosphocholine-specific phospholipase C [Roseateles sp. So40a]|uniref:phosphocholine-specific phospholipase C n=1 Tax=Roseateles sp. So40a TaxID=3400226 RepID=UPI003A842BE8